MSGDIAKIALDIKAKRASDFIGILDEESYRAKLWDHEPITDFWQIAGGKSARLRNHGITTMRQIAMMDENYLYDWFGIDAELLIDHAWGRESTTIADIKAYRSKSKSLSSGQVLMRDYKRNEGEIIAKQLKRTHIAKKMKALPNYPMSKLYSTIGEFASKFHGCEYDEDHKAYGYYCNPNAKWDWYVIGGRWPITFLVKDSCTESCIGERYWGDEDTVYSAPEGYKWVSAARKKNIECSLFLCHTYHHTQEEIRCEKSVLIAMRSYPVWKAVPEKQFVIPTVLFPVSVSATRNMTGGGVSVQAVVFWWVVTTMNIPPNKRSILLLSFFGEYSDCEIARLLGISNATVSYRKKRCTQAVAGNDGGNVS